MNQHNPSMHPTPPPGWLAQPGIHATPHGLSATPPDHVWTRGEAAIAFHDRADRTLLGMRYAPGSSPRDALLALRPHRAELRDHPGSQTDHALLCALGFQPQAEALLFGRWLRALPAPAAPVRFTPAPDPSDDTFRVALDRCFRHTELRMGVHVQPEPTELSGTFWSGTELIGVALYYPTDAAGTWASAFTSLLPKARGRGLAAFAVQAGLHAIRKAGGLAYVDLTDRRNQAMQRAFQRNDCKFLALHRLYTGPTDA